MLRGDDGRGHRALAISALVIVLTICMPIIRREDPSTQPPRCKDQSESGVAKAPAPSGATVSIGGYQLQGVVEDLRCFLSLLCGFCGMHILHVMQQSFQPQGTNEVPLVDAAEGPENQDVKLCFSVGM
eukprot:gnl/MRDRNA2_/MRDRNA2_155124_c0_seq1.p1 gnl/MRDRNA2_/MRDRNA2_155124_c0~~gnl/MRDRNA2_/MRDRNA2_155124_c0_seq1.p1  ORF type:complete len:128 (+),score=20.94 gnl/MRDRNA2_/MRDRNA2_155124_c0_seq1:94-477(+)